MFTSPVMAFTEVAVTLAVLTPPPSFKSYSIPPIVAVSASLVWSDENATVATIKTAMTAIAFNTFAPIC